MKILKPISYLAIASFLAFAPIKAYAQPEGFTVKIEFPEEQRELANYIVDLATDINDDGKPDKKGYETLLTKLGVEYDKEQSLEELQKKMQNYVTSLKTKHQLDELAYKSFSMFTKKDTEMYSEKAIELIVKALEELGKSLENLDDRLNKIEKERQN